MADAKHTRGPLSPTRDPETGNVGILDDDLNVVAECYAAIRRHDERADDEAMANARLFAAAPQLLEALSVALELLKAVEPCAGQEDLLSGCVEIAAAVIAKATGAAS